MIEQFTVEEINLLCFFDTGTRGALLSDLIEAVDSFSEDEILEIAQSALNKVSKMSDADFAALDFYPVYDDEETEVYA